ncbi:MAG: ABC transporter permease [Armatimonadetes bacterium]|nr:ABC transporter permease [Armatimonadota bacterium]
MLGYVIRRVFRLAVVLITVYTLVFVAAHAIPGGPFEEGDMPITKEALENIRKRYRLDQPVWRQYLTNLWAVVRHGDLGPSYISAHRTVNDILGDHFPVSLQLGLLSMLLSVAVGVPIGVLSATRHNSWIDHGGMFFALIGISVPNFVMTPLLIVLLAVWLRWLPSGGWDGLLSAKVVIPALALAFPPAAALARYTRSTMLGVLGMDYVRTARAKGLMEFLVIVRHALRNALIPVMTVAGLYLARVVTGSFFVETIAAVPGIGRYFITSISTRDYPVMLGTTLLLAFVVAVVNLIVDLLYAVVDPRIHYA